MAKFFVSCNPGLEEILLKELHEVSPYLIEKDGRSASSRPQNIESTLGGIEFEWELELGVQLNFFLKTAHRVLLRLGQKNVYQFIHLESWLKQLNPQKITGRKTFRYQVACSQSKLGQEKRVKEVVEKHFGTEQEDGDLLMLRIFQDRAELSLDTSGEHLHFRGYRAEQGAAPIRESLAAALLYEMSADLSLEQLSQMSLCDLFCGSGTLLLEASRLHRPEKNRDYAFQSWAQIPKIFKDKNIFSNYRGFSEITWKKMFAADVDAEVLIKAKNNAKQASVENIFFHQQDSATAPVHNFLEQEKLFLISNPPYEKRIDTQGEFSTMDSLKKIMKLYKPERAGYLIPQNWNLEFADYKVARKLQFKNGGLPVKFLVFTKN